jgi:hypothetical protein
MLNACACQYPGHPPVRRVVSGWHFGQIAISNYRTPAGRTDNVVLWSTSGGLFDMIALIQIRPGCEAQK